MSYNLKNTFKTVLQIAAEITECVQVIRNIQHYSPHPEIHEPLQSSTLWFLQLKRVLPTVPGI